MKKLVTILFILFSVGLFAQKNIIVKVPTDTNTVSQMINVAIAAIPSISYPNTTKKYINGYGNFPSLSIDSLVDGWKNVSGGIEYTLGQVNITRAAGAALRLNTTAAGKNWGIMGSNQAYGDLTFMQSTSDNGNPITSGTPRLYFDYLGNFGIGTYNVTLGDGTYNSSGTFQSDGVNGNYLVLRKPDLTNFTQGIYIQDKTNNAGWNFGVNQAGKAIIGYGSGANETVAVGVGRLANMFVIDTTGTIGMGTASPNASAQLDITSTTKGVLFPRLNTVQMNAVSSPYAGLIITNTDSLNRLFIYTGTAWKGLAFTDEASSGTTGYDSQTATASQTAFTFPSVPSSYNDFWIDINGATIPQSFYTKSGSVVTFSTGLQLGAIVTYHRIK